MHGEYLLNILSFVCLTLNMVLAYFSIFFYKKKNLWVFSGNLFLQTANFLVGFLLLWRWVSFHQFPISNLYESLLFLVWILTQIQILLSKEEGTKTDAFTNPVDNTQAYIENSYQSFGNIAILLSPMTLLTYSFAIFNLPTSMQKVLPLVPALQSNWLMMHVTLMLISYGFLIAGSVFAFAFLFLSKRN